MRRAQVLRDSSLQYIVKNFLMKFKENRCGRKNVEKN